MYDIGRLSATEMKRSGIEGAESKCGQAEHAARMEPKRKPVTEMERSKIEVRSTAKVKEQHI